MSADRIKCLVWDLDDTLWRGTLLEGDSVHYSITNSGASDATFTIKMIVVG